MPSRCRTADCTGGPFSAAPWAWTLQSPTGTTTQTSAQRATVGNADDDAAIAPAASGNSGSRYRGSNGSVAVTAAKPVAIPTSARSTSPRTLRWAKGNASTARTSSASTPGKNVRATSAFRRTNTSIDWVREAWMPLSSAYRAQSSRCASTYQGPAIANAAPHAASNPRTPRSGRTSAPSAISTAPEPTQAYQV